MNRTAIAAVAAVLLLTLTGCAESADNASDERVAPASASEEATETPAPLEAEEPGTAADDEAESAFLEFVRGRLETFPSQIPDATDAQLFDAAADACERIRGGESVEKMSVIDGEQPSEVGGYFYDSNAIIAGAQMHLCPDTMG
ncbi:hypothetical protein [Microbacterium sp. Root280D1]|uniref:hypothetical protein n=1 Tax=Microbacterium sp. Root280D1 TaxID=1736510 RepID=UPI0007008848|nr:hypothetical protein [Microbacterium sp. Root280D1]KRD51969.1 hypothetical protein ASE34_08615 [Microbacterium sp. Root280D1]